MESTKLSFLDLKGASESELALLERLLAPEHSKVELPVDDLPVQPVYETCRLPPDGTEYATDEATPAATKSPPPPQPPPPPQQQPHITPANQPSLAGDLPVSSPSALPPMAATPHFMPPMLPGAGAMFPQATGGFPFPQNFPFVNLPGAGGVNMMYPLPPMPPAGYPSPEPTMAETGDRRRSGGAKKGGDKPLSALAAPYQHTGYPMTPRSATGQPLMMQPFGGHPYGAQYYPFAYPYYPYPGGEMMLAPVPPQQLQQMQQQQLDVTPMPPPPPAVEETRPPLGEPYGRAEEPVQADTAEEAVPSPTASADGDAAADDDSDDAATTDAGGPVAPSTSDERPAPGPASAAAVAAAAGPVRLSFGFDLEDKLGDGDSEAVQLENTGTTPEPPTAPEERAGDGRSSSAEPTEPCAPTSYVATVTVSQRHVVPPPQPEMVPSLGEEVESGRGSPAEEATSLEEETERIAPNPEMEVVGLPEPQAATPANGTTSPESEPEPEQERPESEQEPVLQLQGEVKDPAPAPAPAPPAPRSWASLFSKKTEDTPPPPVVPVTPKPAPPPPVPDTDRETIALGEALSRFEICHKHVYLQPRGLTNKSNWCYINAVLQALASCTPFYHMMKALPHNVGVLPDESRTPIIDAMVEFVREFSPLPELPRIPRRDRGQLRDIQPGPPLEPSYVYAMLSRVSSDAFRVAGRQEDAEEFLTCLLSGLQDEMTEVLKVYQKSREDGRLPVNGATNGDVRHDSEDEGDSDDWQTIIGKNRGQVTRSAELQSTPISRVFSGQLRSSLHRQGAKATATVQSFFSLQLDIQSPQISSVEQALEALVERDPVVGLTCPQSGRPIDAYHQAALELTPPTLILHLKRFLYDPETDGVQKLLKRVTFPIDLELKKELLSNVRTKMSPGMKRYRLFAVVYHSGKESTKGHYITDAYHPAYLQWVRYDDSSISAVAETTVLRPEPPLVPYILFYRRVDTVAAHNGK